MNSPTPDYKKIYLDITSKKHPEKREICKALLEKESLSAIDIIKLNKIVFGQNEKTTNASNQQLRSYSKSDIFKFLEYQKKHNLNNIQLANHFKLSRNSVTKWKKIYPVV